MSPPSSEVDISSFEAERFRDIDAVRSIVSLMSARLRCRCEAFCDSHSDRVCLTYPSEATRVLCSGKSAEKGQV